MHAFDVSLERPRPASDALTTEQCIVETLPITVVNLAYGFFRCDIRYSDLRRQKPFLSNFPHQHTNDIRNRKSTTSSAAIACSFVSLSTLARITVSAFVLMPATCKLHVATSYHESATREIPNTGPENPPMWRIRQTLTYMSGEVRRHSSRSVDKVREEGINLFCWYKPKEKAP